MRGRRADVLHRLLLGLAGIILALPVAAQEQTDLRDFRVGEPVRSLPSSGYIGFACADAPGEKLSGWAEYAKCPRDATGLHAVGFRYDPVANPMGRINDSYEGTRVAGQPVLLALLISDNGVVDGIRIATDPQARLYLRKKAFLFGLQVRARYGEDGWHCRQDPPAAGEEPVGGVFIKEHCDKVAGTRHLVVDRELYRRTDQKLKDFVGGSQVLILLAG